MSLTGDLIRLQTCICRPLLLIHLHICCIIDHKEPNIWTDCIYYVLHGSVHVWRACVFFFVFVGARKQLFLLFMKALQLLALLIWCVCAWDWNANLPIVSQPVVHQHFIVDSSLTHICMFTKWVQVLNWTAELQDLHLWKTVWMYLMSNVCLFMSVSSGSVSVSVYNNNKL